MTEVTPFALAGPAEAAAAEGWMCVAVVLWTAGLLLLGASLFRSVPLTGCACAICLLLGLLGGFAAFSPVPDSQDPDVHYWDSRERALGWTALGLATASVGCLGLVCFRASPRARLASAVPVVAGCAVMLVNFQLCFILLLCVGGSAYYAVASQTEARHEVAPDGSPAAPPLNNAGTRGIPASVIDAAHERFTPHPHGGAGSESVVPGRSDDIQDDGG